MFGTPAGFIHIRALCGYKHPAIYKNSIISFSSAQIGLGPVPVKLQHTVRDDDGFRHQRPSTGITSLFSLQDPWACCLQSIVSLFSSGMTSRILGSQTSKQHAPQKWTFGLWPRSFPPLVQPNYHGFWSLSWPLSSLWNSRSQNTPVRPHMTTTVVPWGCSRISGHAGGPNPDHPPTYLKALSKPNSVPWSLWATSRAVPDLTCCPARHIHQGSTLFRHPGGWINFPLCCPKGLSHWLSANKDWRPTCSLST